MAVKKTTIHDIARELDITASTVSRALKNHPRISDNTKKLVIATAKKMNYQPNSIAAALRQGTSKLVGILVPTIDRNFFGTIVRGVEEILNEAGYNVIISQSNDSPEKERANLKALLEAQVDGVFASFAKENTSFEHFQTLIDQDIPLILFDRTHESLNVDSVVIDDYNAAYKATEHLISQGCKRILHFTSNSEISIYRERKRGYQDALQHHNIALDESLIWKSSLKLEDGRELGEKIISMETLPDAVFSASDFAAMGAMEVIKKNGFSIPEDIKFFGFSNDTFTELVDPPLSSIDQLSMNIGQILANKFLERIKAGGAEYHPRRTVLTPELIIRKSSQKN